MKPKSICSDGTKGLLRGRRAPQAFSVASSSSESLGWRMVSPLKTPWRRDRLSGDSSTYCKMCSDPRRFHFEKVEPSTSTLYLKDLHQLSVLRTILPLGKYNMSTKDSLQEQTSDILLAFQMSAIMLLEIICFPKDSFAASNSHVSWTIPWSCFVSSQSLRRLKTQLALETWEFGDLRWHPEDHLSRCTLPSEQFPKRICVAVSLCAMKYEASKVHLVRF